MVLSLACVAACAVPAPPGPLSAAPVQAESRAMPPSPAGPAESLPGRVTLGSPPPLDVLEARVEFIDVSAGRPVQPPVAAAAGILVDVDAGLVLWQHNADTPRPPASTTKLMSALVAMRNFPMDSAVTVGAAAATRGGEETQMGLRAGERLTVRELLTGMLMVSANDAAMSIAGDTVGMERFVDTMNAQAAALGLTSTHFENPSGYPDAPAQLTTARDLAALTSIAYRRYPIFQELSDTHDTVIPANAGHQEFVLHNILSRLYASYPALVGGKSGFTYAAGPCLVTVAVRDGHRLIAVLLDAPHMVDDTRTLLEWGFSQEGLAPLPAPTPSPAGPRP
ncbi:MAG: hypothetical protein QOE92_1079 [Chloroflexota bacterium]|nr:hypothetical protein [Chloroflexota bacterium]